MKAFKYIIFLAIVSFLCACSNNDDDVDQAVNQFQSSICPTITGSKAIYWDGSHNLPTSLSQIPTIANPGQQFIHSQYPALGFFMPQGYVAEEIWDAQTSAVGVNVKRNDGNVVWRYIPSAPLQGQVQIADIVNFEINQIKATQGVTEMGVIVCAEDFVSHEFGFPTSFSSRLITFGNFTAQLIVQTHFMPSLGNTFATVTLASAPTTEYDNLVMETYLPLHWQLLVISDDVRDSDLDGTPDNQDSAPFNSNVQ